MIEKVKKVKRKRSQGLFCTIFLNLAYLVNYEINPQVH